ncbi:unnamed protein product, partial [Rotaria socialis]
TAEQAASVSYLRLTPILNLLRVRPNDHATAASSSSYTSSFQLGLLASTSKNKHVIRFKKRIHSSKDK